MGAAEAVIYAYGLVPRDYSETRFPAGLDGAPVELLRTGVCGVLVSRLPARGYAPDVIESSSGDVGWLSPRAVAHDGVLTWAQEHGGPGGCVVPLPMFTLFGSDAALRQSMEARADSIARIFVRVAGADEFGVRIHRRDEQMLAAIDQLDPAIAALRRDAASASPGQRYLLERKLHERARTAVRAASQRIAREIHESLRALSRDAISRPPTPDPARADVTLVLNGAFLVDRGRIDDFRACVGAHMQDFGSRGLVFDFTGPWPPYNFVADLAGGGNDGDAQAVRA